MQVILVDWRLSKLDDDAGSLKSRFSFFPFCWASFSWEESYNIMPEDLSYVLKYRACLVNLSQAVSPSLFALETPLE